jgi:dihydrofolate reductase
VKLIIIAALARNRVIGKGGTIPWHLSEDLKRFKKITMGHTVLMGRITYESIGKPLPGRKNVVITSKSIKPPSIYSSTQLLTFSDLDTALTALKNDEKVFIIGGGQLYKQIFLRADELLLTFLDREYDGDVYFPEYEEFIKKHFRLQNEEIKEGYTFRDYLKTS